MIKTEMFNKEVAESSLHVSHSRGHPLKGTCQESKFHHKQER
jgi:hypothetical protein